MPQEFDSLGLAHRRQVLQVRSGMPERVELQSELIQSVLESGPFLRRGLLPPEQVATTARGLPTGWWTHILTNTHGAANVQSSTYDPYAPGSPTTASWPNPLPEEFDAFLAMYSGHVTTGTSVLTFGRFGLQLDAGHAIEGAGATTFFLQSYNSEAQLTGLQPSLQVADRLPQYWKLPMRIPRGSNLLWQTESSGIAAFQLHLGFVLVPAGYPIASFG